MVLIESTKESYEVLAKGSIDELMSIIDELSKSYETKGIMLVSEENEPIVKTFATKDKGYHSSLIICNNVATKLIKKCV